MHCLQEWQEKLFETAIQPLQAYSWGQKSLNQSVESREVVEGPWTLDISTAHKSQIVYSTCCF